MDIQTMFVANKAIADITNNINLADFTPVEKELLVPVMEEIVNVYHGVPEVEYNPSADTSGLLPIRLMLFATDLNTRKLAFNMVRMRLNTLVNSSIGLTAVDAQTAVQRSQDVDPREIMRQINTVSANTRKLIQIMNNLCVVVYPIITNYEEVKGE